MTTYRTRQIAAYAALGLGAVAVLVTGLDHFDEYAVNNFSSVPTIGTLFLLNFVAASIVGVALLLPWRRITLRFADSVRAVLALSGIAIAASSLIGLWISETWGLFGFTDYGFRSAIVVAIVAESSAIVALSAYLALIDIRPSHLLRPARSH